MTKPTGSVGHLGGHRHCLVITYRRDGAPVPTPVWFGLDEGRVYFRAERSSGKVKRLRATTHVRVAPCTSRGKPTGAPFEGHARIVAGELAAKAEQVIQSRYSIGRRIYERLFTVPEGVYVEVTPIPFR